MADLTWNKGGKRLLAGIDRLIELLYQFDENELAWDFACLGVLMHV